MLSVKRHAYKQMSHIEVYIVLMYYVCNVPSIIKIYRLEVESSRILSEFWIRIVIMALIIDNSLVLDLKYVPRY